MISQPHGWRRFESEHLCILFISRQTCQEDYDNLWCDVMTTSLVVDGVFVLKYINMSLVAVLMLSLCWFITETVTNYKYELLSHHHN